VATAAAKLAAAAYGVAAPRGGRARRIAAPVAPPPLPAWGRPGLLILHNWGGDAASPEAYRGVVLSHNAATGETTVRYVEDDVVESAKLDPEAVLQVCSGCAVCQQQGCDACAVKMGGEG
jgi:hypothetical protein